jgi:hypothetical protein
MTFSGLSASFLTVHATVCSESGKVAVALKGSIPEWARGMTNGVLELGFGQPGSGWQECIH